MPPSLIPYQTSYSHSNDRHATVGDHFFCTDHGKTAIYKKTSLREQLMPPRELPCDIDGLRSRLTQLDKEREEIILQIQRLESEVVLATELETHETRAEYYSIPTGQPTASIVAQDNPSLPLTPAEKIALFASLFRNRDDVFARHWKSADGKKSGYSPVCRNEWQKGICDKPRVKCAACPSRAFAPFNDQAIEAHLTGKMLIGCYAIHADDSCRFLACDFDDAVWQEDAIAYRDAGTSLGIDVALERSRSGNGAHAWIFFENPVPASLARALGTLILSQAQERLGNMKLSSFDRFFPNQDTIPRGGFGNLIALPLERNCRDKGTCVFLDKDMNPYPDQWAHLASIEKVSLDRLQAILKQYIPPRNASDRINEETRDELLFTPADDAAGTKMDADIEIKIASQITIPTDAMTKRMITALSRLATFPNPKYYELQRLRFPTYPHPRFLFTGELQPGILLLPRGLFDKAIALLKKAGARVTFLDTRTPGHQNKIDQTGAVEFHGSLHEAQQLAIEAVCSGSTDSRSIEMLAQSGVLVGPPGSGKTVIGCALIARIALPTLVIVHRKPLVEQWQESLVKFLGCKKTEIGRIEGVKRKHGALVDIAMLQTLVKAVDIDELAQYYGFVIIDECHHIPAASFEGVLKEFKARYIIGLTATPYRKDRLERIIFQQCGPILHTIDMNISTTLIRRAIIRNSTTCLSTELGERPPYHAFAEAMATSTTRNMAITSDIADLLQRGHFPLILSDRKAHLDILESMITAEAAARSIQEIVLCRIDGSMSAKQRKNVLARMAVATTAQKPVCLFTTASLFGEGFDLPALDSLVLTMPLSFRGRLVQYAGRLHREHGEKREVVIHDYVERDITLSWVMYRRRMRAYREMGYNIEEV